MTHALHVLVDDRSRIELLGHVHRAPEAAADIGPWLRDGKLQPLETVVEGFEQLPTAINMLFDGANTGKLVVRVSD